MRCVVEVKCVNCAKVTGVEKSVGNVVVNVVAVVEVVIVVVAAVGVNERWKVAERMEMPD